MHWGFQESLANRRAKKSRRQSAADDARAKCNVSLAPSTICRTSGKADKKSFFLLRRCKCLTNGFGEVPYGQLRVRQKAAPDYGLRQTAGHSLQTPLDGNG